MAECKECMHKAVCHKALQIREDLLKKINCYDFKSAADVAEVRHARWKECEGGLFYCCSECGHLIEYQFSNYCPNCGAIMDGK